MADVPAASNNADGELKAPKKQVCRFFTAKGMYLERGTDRRQEIINICETL